jgi:hypothetical protein
MAADLDRAGLGGVELHCITLRKATRPVVEAPVEGFPKAAVPALLSAQPRALRNEACTEFVGLLGEIAGIGAGARESHNPRAARLPRRLQFLACEFIIADNTISHGSERHGPCCH